MLKLGTVAQAVIPKNHRVEMQDHVSKTGRKQNLFEFPYILRADLLSSSFRTQRRLTEARRGYGCLPLATLRGTDNICLIRKRGGGGRRKGKEIGWYQPF